MQKHLASFLFKNPFYSNRNLTWARPFSKKKHCKVLVVGGGPGGCSVAARLARVLRKKDIIIVEPKEVHVYKSGFTFIGAGIMHMKDIVRPMLHVLPENATWLKDSVKFFRPANNMVTLESGTSVQYEFMVIAVGMKVDFDKIYGLKTALSTHPNVCTVYSEDYAEKTYECFERFSAGTAIFTAPKGAVSCGAAALEMAYFASNYFRKRKHLSDIMLIFATAKEELFPVDVYEDTLYDVAKRLQINVNLQLNLVEIRPEGNKAIFACVNKPGKITCLKYSLLHVGPPMSPPNALKDCKELVTKEKYVDIDWNTLQHMIFKNIFAIGDCISNVGSKTSNAIAHQSAVVFKNLTRVMEGEEPEPLYYGYTACPIATGYDSLVLAEYDRRKTPVPTFPFTTEKERGWLYHLDKTLMPYIYWNYLLKGMWDGPETVGNIFHVDFLKR